MNDLISEIYDILDEMKYKMFCNRVGHAADDIVDEYKEKIKQAIEADWIDRFPPEPEEDK